MADMLVKLYNIPNSHDIEKKLLQNGIRIKKALAPDRSKIIAFSRICAKDDYSDEVRAAFSNNPVTCYIATREKELIGFACYEATARNFFGPMAVLESERKKGVGKALLLKALESMRELGYAYAIIGWPANSAVSFYKKCAGAIMIDEKSSGVYKRMVEIDE
jgi:GNAT superfamily N-acetyltransferase